MIIYGRNGWQFHRRVCRGIPLFSRDGRGFPGESINEIVTRPSGARAYAGKRKGNLLGGPLRLHETRITLPLASHFRSIDRSIDRIPPSPPSHPRPSRPSPHQPQPSGCSSDCRIVGPRAMATCTVNDCTVTERVGRKKK